MNKPPNLHSNFFSSLKQVEKRLKLEKSPSSKPSQSDYTSSESLGSPIYLYPIHHNTTTHNSNLDEYSETPNEFLTNSIDFPPSLEDPLPETPQNLPKTSNWVENEDVDEMGLVIELLGLVGFEGDEPDSELNTCSSCHCGGGFFERIVGVKGPKCGKEVERLEGWIRHFRKARIEPLRMAHLLLGKAAFVSGGGEDFEGVEFPSTVEEFLKIDYPIANED